MAERKVRRVRPSDFRLGGGVDATLSRRTSGRRASRSNTPKAASPTVVGFFGDNDDTPVTELLKAIPAAVDHFREGDHIHVSDLIKRCVRRIALMRQMHMSQPAEAVRDGMGITFAIGEALHDYVKARFIKGHPDKVYARWMCVCRETQFVGIYRDRPKELCTTCQQPVDNHHEIAFIHEEYDLQGSPDLLLHLPDYDAFFVTELKSIAANQWKELVRALPDHIIQVALYWYILKACGFTLVDRVSVLYVNKEWSFKLPYKEFIIDPQAVDLSPYWEDLEALKTALNGGPLPPRVQCGTPDAPDAKKCPVCVTCFQVD